MHPPLTLSTSPPEHPAMDYEFLRQEGIRHLERMAGDLWTDFNTHDPGITILEGLCYALTDLAHRINYDIPDLFSSDGHDLEESLFSPAQILTSASVTMEDLRKLAIDVQGVKNAWIEKIEAQAPELFFYPHQRIHSLKGDPLTAEPVHLKGLYRLLIELSDDIYHSGIAGEKGAHALEQVTQSLHAQRGLCQDIENISILEPQYIQIRTSIEIERVDEAGEVLLQIYQRIADYISPPIRFHSLSDLLASGQGLDEIFDGPRLAHGFIDTKSLQQAQRRSELRTSDLISEIMAVPNVRAVRTIAISKGELGQDQKTKWEDWFLKLDSEKAPKLDIDASSITLERNQLPVALDLAKVRRTYYSRIRLAADTKPGLDENDLPLPKGRDRQIANYTSIQHQFPATYGVGPLSLPRSAAPQRVAQTKQLKAYLMFFDQLLANYFAQLAHVRELFSFEEADQSGDIASTYFSQIIHDPSLKLDEIRQSELASHEQKLRAITENPHQVGGAQMGDSRRNRFLNHLLARFAEQFTDYSLVIFGAMQENGDSSANKLIADKSAFLREYPQISAARGAGINYLQPLSQENTSGLEKRLRRLLGIAVEDPEETFYLVEHILLRPMAADESQDVPILADSQRKDPFSLQLSFVFPNWPLRFIDPGFRIFVERTVREETPAHLSLTIQWLDQTAMPAFEDAYNKWLEKRRQYWLSNSGEYA
jgi:hypothetical protein